MFISALCVIIMILRDSPVSYLFRIMKERGGDTVKKRRRFRLLRSFFIIILVFLIFWGALYTDRNLRTIILESAENKVGLLMSDCANEAVNISIDGDNIKYDDIIVVSRNQNGDIKSIQTDINKLNLIRTRIDKEFSKQMEKHSTLQLSIPIGSVIGNEYTVGRGPCINYKLGLSVNTSTDYKSQFYSAGINQTLHQITIEVSGEAYIMSPWYRESIDFYTEYIVAETIITGVVPDTLADFDVKK